MAADTGDARTDTDGDRPNVLVLLSDQHSPRQLGHGTGPVDEPVSTPTLSGLAAESADFDSAYCQAPVCTPSRIAMVTGRSMPATGGWANHSRIPGDAPTLPGVFSAAGYETCLVGKMHLGGDRQFAGFDHRPYGDLTGTSGHQFEPLFESPPDYNARKGAGKPYAHFYGEPGALESVLTTAGETEIPESLLQESNVTAETLSWLREHRHRRPETPWFCVASYSRPHPPLTAPRRFADAHDPESLPPPAVDRTTPADDHPLVDTVRGMFGLDAMDEAAEPDALATARAGYFACVEYLDELLGDALAAFERDGFLEDTIVVYVSDHGEMAGEHGLWGKYTWHEPSVRVPLSIQLPGHRSGDREPATVESPASLADLFPTLCGLTGVDPPEGLDGTDLSASVLGGAEPDRGPVVADYAGETPAECFRMVRGERYKYVRFGDGAQRCYDLVRDPLETSDLLAEAGEAVSDDAVIDAVAEAVDELSDPVDSAAVPLESYAERRAADLASVRDHQLPIPRGHGNAYRMPDGRVVDADTPLYRPFVLSTDFSRVVEDHPED